MDGPPTRIMYSPDAGDAACEASANIDKKQTSKRRFIIAGDWTIYAARKTVQALESYPAIGGRDQPASAIPAITDLAQLHRAPDPATFAAFESARTCRC